MIDDILLYELKRLSRAKRRAERLEQDREIFHAELYQSIVYPSTWLDYTEERLYSASTELQGIKIANAKERYEREIQKEYERYNLWLSVLSWLDDNDRKMLMNHVTGIERSDLYKIKRILRKIVPRYNKELEKIECEKDVYARETMKYA